MEEYGESQTSVFDISGLSDRMVSFSKGACHIMPSFNV
jgi:hypothetical protein